MGIAKRLSDIILATILLLLTLPVLVVVLLATWMELRCNVIFAEKRVGRGGQLFTMYKVTSMKPTKENIAARALGPIKKNDPRLTWLGRFIRRYSLDELPQFVNVIKGDMSIVGPRPELPKAVERWKSELVSYHKRLDVLPGMTGWAQVNGYRKGYIKPERRLEYDLYYIANMSIWFDLWIILLTPMAVIRTEVW